jgi:3-keto-disaccharide hydrolase
MSRRSSRSVMTMAVVGLAGCMSSGNVAAGAAQSGAPAMGRPGAMNTLTSGERFAGWRLLFDGTTTNAWRGYKTDVVPAGWRVDAGTLTKSTGTGDLVTREQFGDFELSLDWMIGPGGNAGIFYRATEEYDHIYWSGPEYQLLDDAKAPDGRSRLTSAGADYGLYPAPEGFLKPAGEWNSTRIVAKGAHVEHWLNGQQLLAYDFWSPDWEAKVKASKFGAWPNYGRARRGYIGIQGDHNGVLTLRNIRIRELK